MSISDVQRVRFHVVRWDRESQRGYITDKTGYEFLMTRANLAPECKGQLAEGDLVSGVTSNITVSDILIESGDRAIGTIREEKP